MDAFFKDLAESQRLLIQSLMDENARLRGELHNLLAARDLQSISADSETGTPSAGFLRDLAELQAAVKNRRDLRAETLSGGMES
jgi:hypothetical protein